MSKTKWKSFLFCEFICLFILANLISLEAGFFDVACSLVAVYSLTEIKVFYFSKGLLRVL